MSDKKKELKIEYKLNHRPMGVYPMGVYQIRDIVEEMQGQIAQNRQSDRT